MANGKKYQSIISQQGNAWLAQIVRQVTSKKTTISKEQGGFASEHEALAWGAEALLEFTAKQNSSNRRHAAQRKEIAETRRQRSSRRADKTAAEKEAKAALKASLDADTQTDTE